MDRRTWRATILAVVSGFALVGLACGPKGTNPTNPDSINRAPVVQSIQFDPTPVVDGGSATVRVSAIDPDGDTLTVAYTVTRGTITVNPAHPFEATYQHPGGGVADSVKVTVTDTKLASASKETDVPLAGAAAPTPAPTPTPTPSNRPPTVTVAPAAATCHPLPATPCHVTCTATASDPDGDPLTYSWSGCASGTASTATCTIPDLAAHTCDVAVSDGKGGTGNANATVTGTNQAPTYVSSDTDPAQPLPCNTTGVHIYVYFADADDTSGKSCSVSAVAPGTVCTLVSTACSGMTMDLTINTTQNAAGANCVVGNPQWKDPWNATNTSPIELRFTENTCP